MNRALWLWELKEAGIRMDLDLSTKDVAMLTAVTQAKRTIEAEMKTYREDRARLDALTAEKS